MNQEMENGFWGMTQELESKKGPWTAEEDERLRRCVTEHGIGNWVTIEKRSGLGRTSKSCRLRWINHLRPHLKKGSFSVEEEMLLVKLHKVYGNKWSYIASKLPGRTDNEIKNFWHGRVRRCHRKFLPIYPENMQDRDESRTYSLEMDGNSHQNDQNSPSIYSPQQGQSSSNLPSPIFSCPAPLPSPNRHSSVQHFREQQCMVPPQQGQSSSNLPSPIFSCPPPNHHSSVQNFREQQSVFTPMRHPPVLSPLVGNFNTTCSPLTSPSTMTQFPASESWSAPSDICSSGLNQHNLYTNSVPHSMHYSLGWDSFVSEPPSIQTPTSAYRPIPEMRTDVELLNKAPIQAKLSGSSDLLSRRLCRKFSDNPCLEASDSVAKISRREGLLCEISKTGVLLVEKEKKETIVQGLMDKRPANRTSASKRSKPEDGYKRWKRNGIISSELHSEIMYKNPVEDVVLPGESLESLRYRFDQFKDHDAFCGVPGGISRGQEDDLSTFDLEFCDMDVVKPVQQLKCSSFSQEIRRGDFMDENLLNDGSFLLTSNDNQEIILEDIWNSIPPEVPSGESLRREVFADNGWNEHSGQKQQQEMQEACNMAEEMLNMPDWYDMGCQSSAISDMVFELEMN